MGLDGRLSNQSPETTNYLTRVEKRLKDLQAQISALKTSSSYLSKKVSAVFPKIPAPPETGRFVHTTNIPVSGSQDWTITLPTGRFEKPPIVTYSVSNNRLGMQVDTITETSFRLYVTNWTSGVAIQPITISWVAEDDQTVGA